MHEKWFKVVFWGMVLFFSYDAAAQEANMESELMMRYEAEAQAEADEVLRKFESAVKPRYQSAYEDYLYDLQIIAKTGKAPDNEALYDDLRLMKDNQIFIYADSQE